MANTRPVSTSPQPRTVEVREPLRRLLLAVGFGALALLTLQFYLYVSLLKITDMFGWAWIFYYVQFAYVLLSFRIVGGEEVGAIALFGKYEEEVSSGLVFVPFGLYSLKKDSMLMFQMELPADPEKIYHGKADEVPDGFYPPIRVTSATKVASGTKNINDEHDPLDTDRITYEVVPIVRWRIEKGQYITFLRTVGSPEEVRRQFSDTATSAAVEYYSGCTVAYALKNINEAHNHLTEVIEGLTNISLKVHIKGSSGTETNVDDPDGEQNAWGIHVESVRIKLIGFHRALNLAIAAPATAKLTALETVTKAEAEKTKRIREGEGTGKAEQAIIDGRTDGMKRQREELGVSGAMVMSAETARGITSNPGQKTVIVGSGGFAELAGTVFGLAEALKSSSNKDTPSPQHSVPNKDGATK